MSFPTYVQYRDSGVPYLGRIPNQWKTLPLKRIGSIRYGIGEPPKYHADGTPLIRATNVSAGKLVADGMVYVDPQDIPENRIVWLAEGDIVVVRSGAYTGDSAIIPAGLDRSIAGFDMVLRCHSAAPQFIQFALLSKYLKEGQIDLEKMRAAQPHLNAEELGGCFIALPDSEEQSYIVAFLAGETAKIDALIFEQQRMIELLNEKRQALIAHTVTKGLNPNAPMKDSGVDWLGPVPAHWQVLRNKVVFKEIDERSPSGDEELLTVSHLTGVTPRSEKNVNMIMAETLEGYKKCQAGDLVINTMWAWMGALGISPCDGLVSPSYNVYRPRTSDLIEPAFYDCLCRTPLHVVTIKAHSTGVWESRLRLYPEAFLDLRSPVPPITEQVAIVDFLKSEVGKLDALMIEAESAIVLLQERRTALISAAVTGKIDVRGLVDAKPAQVAAA